MSKKNPDGTYTWTEEEDAEIEMSAEARRRAHHKIEADKAPCEICGKPKGTGEHGKDKCKKAEPPEPKKKRILD